MIELVEGRKHQVIKRNGDSVEYNPDKMYKVLLWACKDNEILAKELLQKIDIKVFDRITIAKLFEEVIDTASNLISDMYPIWDDVAKRLYLQKVYKETWGIKRSEYPYYGEVLKKGTQYGVYDREVVESFTPQEIEELNSYILPEKDFNLDYLGLSVFVAKQSKKYTANKILELPQHGFMRLAVFAFWKEKENRLELIQERYNQLSDFMYSEATPKWINSMEYNPQMASCVVSRMPDVSKDINKTGSNMGMFSKFGGGLSLDVTPVRSTGSRIGKSGKSSGPVPFIKVIESIVSAYNQNGARPGACSIYFSWWHYDAPEMIELKEEGGTEDRRARKLQYGIKWNRLFTERIINNEEITLFDPKETPELLETSGAEFIKWYTFYENKPKIRKRKMQAIDLAYAIAKQRIETGNLYLFFEETVQTQNVFNRKIHSSNLCNEIYLPTEAPEFLTDSLQQDLSTGDINLLETSKPGLIALCNLSSVNLIKFMNLNYKERAAVAYNLLRASDNLIDYGYYPAKEGEIFNKNYRAIGVGITNYAQFLATQGFSWDSEDALLATNNIMEDIYWHLMNASIQLARERGRYTEFYKGKYAEGEFTFDNYCGPYKFKLRYDWDGLRKDLINSGSRFSTVMAIAPTATSSLIMNSTEGAEPVRKLVSMKTGTYSCAQLAPNLRQLRENYDIAWDIKPDSMINLASVRQRWLDQGQSTSLYYKDRNQSAFEVLQDILKSEKAGLKGLYYAHSPKEDEDIEEGCESCSA